MYRDHLKFHWGLIFDDIRSVLDVGCGHQSSVIKSFRIPFSVGVDVDKNSLSISRENNFHNQYILSDARVVAFKPQSFDLVLCVHCIEHIEKNEGYDLIRKMSEIAKKRIVIMTPNGFVSLRDGGHKSGWSIKDFKDLGFEVVGVDSLKFFSKFLLSPRYLKFRIVRKFVSLNNLITSVFPGLASHLVAIRDIMPEK